MTLAGFRDEFELEPGLIYLNSGTHSLTPKVVRQAQARYEREYERNPTAGLIGAYRRLWQTQTRLARLLGARAEDLFLRANITEAIGEFLLGMPLPAGAEILATSGEYGAMLNQCRFRAERNGLGFRTFALPSRPEELARADAAFWIEAVTRELRPETKLLLVSHVMTGNGLVLPIAEIARETRARGVLLAVDGAHAPGALPFDFSALEEVDFYGGNLHKWVMGPKGTAFGWVAPRHQEALMPAGAGWTTFEFPAHYADFGAGSRFQGRMLMRGCQNFAPFFALNDTFDFWERFGADAIRSRIYALQDRLRGHLRTGVCLSPPAGPRRGPLVAYALPFGTDGSALFDKLLRENRLQVNVVMLSGQPALRLSPHAYNSEAEVDVVAALIAELLA